MPIPALDRYGLLPPGVHDCTVGEIGDRFGGSTEGVRRDLFNGFVEWRGLLLRRGLVADLLVDGSFTTDNEHPRDIDVALRLPPPDREMFRVIQRCADLLDQSTARRDHFVDPWYFFDEPEGPRPVDYAQFFRTMRPEEARQRGVSPDHLRGILRVRP